jgi:hypothetical protein
MSQKLQTYSITAPGFYGLNTQDSSLDLASGFALVANNCIIDQYGRVGARKGWTKVNSALNSDLSTNSIQAIGELIANDGTSYIICAGNNKLFKLSGTSLVTLTYGGGGVAPTITANNWQMANLDGVLTLFQIGHDPLQFDPSVSTTTYKRISEATGYTGTVQLANCVIAAAGRLWNANTSTDKITVQWSDTKQHQKYGGGSSGTLDTHTVWPNGADTIEALGFHNGFLFIFGKNNILIYSGADDPTTMVLYDVVTGIGCITRDSVAYTGTDLVFLSSTGVRSVLRTIAEKSAPFRDLSKNVRNDLINALATETLANINAVYSSTDAFYLLTIPNLSLVYCFDMRAMMQDGSSRVTTWDSITPKALMTSQNGTLYIGKDGYLATHTGYNDNTSTYRMQYNTNHTDLGEPTVTSILKKVILTVIGGSNQYVTIKWAYDFTGDFHSENILIPTQSIAQYGIAEYGSNGSPVAYYSAGIAIQRLVAAANGSGKVVQTGYEAEINGNPLSFQKIEIHAKNGKVM